MPRPSKPWYRAQTGWWMAIIGGKWHKLAKGKENQKQAFRRFHELMANFVEKPESPDARVADLCEEFLEHSRKRHAPDTYRNHRFYIQSFCEASGYLKVEGLKPYHVSRWVESKAWNETSCYNARRFVFRVFSWSMQEGIISVLAAGAQFLKVR